MLIIRQASHVMEWEKPVHHPDSSVMTKATRLCTHHSASNGSRTLILIHLQVLNSAPKC
jgi:hypothetical protein